MTITLFSTISNKDKSDVVEKLITHSTPRQDFYLMVVLSVAMATLGVLQDSAAIVIGSMLISPMLYAFLSLSLGLGMSDTKLIARSLFSIVKAVAAGIAIAALITLFAGDREMTGEVLSRTHPSLLYGVVAFLAGFAAAFSLTKPQLNETLPGVAIAVAVIPPLAVSGVGVATLQWDIFRGSFLLFLLNTAAIVCGSVIVFLLMNIYGKKALAEQTLKEEEKKVAKDEKASR